MGAKFCISCFHLLLVEQKSGRDHSMSQVPQIPPLLSKHKGVKVSEDEASQLVRETFHRSESQYRIHNPSQGCIFKGRWDSVFASLPS